MTRSLVGGGSELGPTGSAESGGDQSGEPRRVPQCGIHCRAPALALPETCTWRLARTVVTSCRWRRLAVPLIPVIHGRPRGARAPQAGMAWQGVATPLERVATLLARAAKNFACCPRSNGSAAPGLLSHPCGRKEVEGQLHPGGAAVDRHVVLAMRLPAEALEVPLDRFKEPYPLDDGGVGFHEP